MHERTGVRKPSVNLGNGAFSLSAVAKYFVLRGEIKNALMTPQWKGRLLGH